MAAFRFAQYELANVGIVGANVLNPVDLCEDLDVAFRGRELSKEELWNACMRRCIAAVTTCDEMIRLPGHQHSRGARIECRIADDLQMPGHDLESFLRERS